MTLQKKREKDKERIVEIKKTLRFQSELAILQQKITENMNSLKSLQNSVKKLESAYDRDLLYIYNNKEKKEINRNRGLMCPIYLPNNLAKLIGVEPKTSMDRPTFTKKLYEILDERGLKYEGNKKVLRADKEIMEIFNLPKSVNESTNPNDKNGFNFSTLQTYIAQIWNTAEKVKQNQIEEIDEPIEEVEEAEEVEED
jgi:hypothetical protein